MKHGRRHDALKERTYRERFAQRAEGYATEYRPLPVADGDPDAPPDPRLEDDGATPVAARLGRKAKKQLKHAGVDADALGPERG